METILSIKKNIEFKILKINSDDSIKQKLFNMGVHPNDKYIKTMGKGPVVIKNISHNSTQIALGSDLASLIAIEIV
ncbi:MAG TPA: hypothetical protein PLE30_01505 [Candidatus Kapabacteria bacterium]|nr:hypothetical protein [Candidatus Kapabacteria bacterium]